MRKLWPAITHANAFLRLLTVAEVAAWLGVTESWVVRAHAAGRRIAA
jgi:hypothetical protein